MNVSKNQFPNSTGVVPELVGNAQQPRKSSATGSNGDDALPSSNESGCETFTSSHYKSASSTLNENSGTCTQRASQNFSGLSVATNSPELQVTTSGGCISAPNIHPLSNVPPICLVPLLTKKNLRVCLQMHLQILTLLVLKG